MECHFLVFATNSPEGHPILDISPFRTRVFNYVAIVYYFQLQFESWLQWQTQTNLSVYQMKCFHGNARAQLSNIKINPIVCIEGAECNLEYCSDTI